ncbi:RNA polymerase sigma-70 factor, ECF subfamily [Verrucomicrobium sp. GAS474]|nr:RNA polymerase sigma-70 factor, ECF subfamily [Verrucomicrobium sp. GAS474]
MQDSAPSPGPTDRDLVSRAQEGDLAAFDELVLRYEKPIRVTLYNILLHHEDTNDALIETFTKAYQNLASFREEAQFSTWLYRIAKNTALNQIRKRKRRPFFSPSQEEEEEFYEGNNFIDNNISADVTRQIENQELQNKLNESLSRLSEEHRMVVSLFDVQGMSHAEIAAIMKCTEGTVRSRLFYAHKQLQKFLKDYKQ